VLLNVDGVDEVALEKGEGQEQGDVASKTYDEVVDDTEENIENEED
jgi:hypothetical protein